MSKIIAGLGAAAVVAVVVTASWVQHEDNRALRREVAALRDELQGEARRNTGAAAVIATVGAASAAGSGETSGGARELAATREEMVALRKSVQQLTQLAQAAQAAQVLKTMAENDAATPTNLVPANAWKNAGKDTPAAAAETVLWAALGGEVETLSNALAFTPSARAKADAWFATLSDSTRAQYGSAEKVIALMIAKDAATLSGMQVLGQKEITADDVGMRLRFASSEGKTKDDTFVMHRSADGWRLLLPDAALDKFTRQLSGKR